jgi:plastocyanin
MQREAVTTMKTNNLSSILLKKLGTIIGSWALWCAPALLAATTQVNIFDAGFSPDQVTINVNDTVQWIWQGYYHSTTSDDYPWDSGVYNLPHSYSFKFTASGSYSYYCSIHYFSGMVNVQGASVPPAVLLTNPPNGEVLSAPASLTLQATTSDSTGTVTNVGFFSGTTLLGNVSSAPFSQVVNGLAGGDYTFSAVASDNQGLNATNTVTVHVVAAEPLVLTAPQWLPGGGLQFSYAATPGLTYTVLRSADLKTWVGINTNVAGGNPVLFQDPGAASGAAYYRLFQRPNP